MKMSDKIELRSLSELLPYARNARTHSESQVKQIAASIREFGFTNPILIKSSGEIIAGHGREAAARLLKLEKVPCIVLDYLTNTQAKAYVLADNQLALNAGWDEEMLKLEIEDLKLESFDIDLIGFDDKFMNAITGDKKGNIEDDEVPPVEKNIHNVKRGQVWKLGEHRLMCGDSTSEADVAKLMDGKRADMLFTDPPYNHASNNDGVAASVSKAHKDLMASEWDKNFKIEPVLEMINKFRSKDFTMYICTSWHLAGKIWEWSATRSNCDGYCVWHKPNPMPSLMKRHWTWASELICYATFGKHVFNFPQEGHALSVWTFNKKSDGSHPTQKPIEVCEHGILASSNQNQLVLDLFLGSGSTLIACEKTNRKCFGCELDEHYCSVIIERFIQFVGSNEGVFLIEDGKQIHISEVQNMRKNI